MSESNGFAVKGTLDMVANGKMDIDQAVEIVNMWIELTAKKFYAEGELDAKRTSRKSHQAMCDMTPEDGPKKPRKCALTSLDEMQTQSPQISIKDPLEVIIGCL